LFISILCTAVYTPTPTPCSSSAWYEVRCAVGIAAATEKETFAGMGANFISSATANSAREPPLANPKTSSPGLYRVTSGATASTTPATSMPATGPVRFVWFGGVGEGMGGSKGAWVSTVGLQLFHFILGAVREKFFD
jgi:hypothetical protein